EELLQLIEYDKKTIKLKKEVTDSGIRDGVNTLKPSTSSEYSISNGELTVIGTGRYANIAFEFLESYSEVEMGDVFYASIWYKPLDDSLRAVRFRLIDTQHRLTDADKLTPNQFHQFSTLETLGRITTRPYGYVEYPTVEDSVGKEYVIKKPLILNLTKIFGKGNEPSKEEVEEILSEIPGQWFDGEVDVEVIIPEVEQTDQMNYN